VVSQFCGTSRDCILTVYGVILHECLHFDEHVCYITAICTQRMYLLKRLRDRRLPVNQLDIVFESLIVNRIRYAMDSYIIAPNISDSVDMLYRPGEALLLLSLQLR